MKNSYSAEENHHVAEIKVDPKHWIQHLIDLTRENKRQYDQSVGKDSYWSNVELTYLNFEGRI